VEGDVTARGGGEPSGTGTLYVVSTPIGNMGDFSFRAVDVLRSVNAVLAEDTRHTRHLLDRYDIRVPAVAYHEHNEAKATPGIVARLTRGESLALVSDAGTPLVSDPGDRLVRAAIEAGIEIVPIPGASALLAALVASGIDAGAFTYYGFLPRTGPERRETLDAVVAAAQTSVLYEAPSRLAHTLGELEQRGAGERQGAVAREMTKQFEETRRGTLSALRTYYESSPPKGEIVIVIAGARPVPASESAVRDHVRALRASGLSARDAATAAAKDLRVPKRLAYRLAQETG
jgi:16S rRNA (cytidine1402-2'-O)-methyltransferase